MTIFIFSTTDETKLSQRINALGYEVVLKGSFEEAYNTLIAEDPDVLVFTEPGSGRESIDIPFPCLFLEEEIDNIPEHYLYLAPPFSDRELKLSLQYLYQQKIFGISNFFKDEELEQNNKMLQFFFYENSNAAFFAMADELIDKNDIDLQSLDKFKITKVNQRLTQLLGVTKEFILSNSLDIIFHASMEDIYLVFNKLFTQGKTSFATTLTGISPNALVVEIDLIAIYNNAEQIIGCYAVIEDITIPYQSRMRLINSKSYFQAILNNSIQAFVLFDAKDYSIKTYNTKAEDIIKFFLNKNFEQSDSIFDYLSPKDKSNFVKIVESLVAKKEYFFHKEYYQEEFDYWFDVSLTPIYELGKVTLISFSLYDITGHKLQERELSLFKRAIDTSPNGFSFVNITGNKDKYVYINQAFTDITQYDMMDVRRDCFQLLTDGISLAKPDTQADNRVRNLIRRKDGSTAWTEVLTTPLFDDQGILTHFVRIYNDVSRKVFFDQNIQKYNDSTATKVGIEFLESITKNITEHTGSKYAYISTKSSGQFETLVYLLDGQVQEIEAYPYEEGSISDIIMRQGRLYCKENATEIYPDDAYIVDNQINAFIGVALIDHKGKPLGVFLILSLEEIPFFDDTTSLMVMLSNRATTEIERMANIENLKLEKKRFQKLAVNSPDVILILERITDLKRKIIYINKKEVLGYDSQEILNEDFFQKIMHPDDLILFRKFKTEVFEKKGCHPQKEIEYRLRHKDGHWEWLNIRHSVYDHKDGESTKMLLHLRVITEKKKAEISLKEQQTNLRSIIENTDDSIWVLDTDLNIIACNQIFENKMQSIYGDQISVGNSLKERKQNLIWQKMYARCFEGEKFDFELAYDDLTLHASFNPIFDADGKVEAINIRASDITEKKKMEEMLVRTNFELDSFVYRSSHDLRAPLRSILGLVDIIRLEKDPDEKLRFLELIQKSVNKLDTLIADMTDFSRNIRLELELNTIDFQSLFDGVYENLQYMDRADNVIMTIEAHMCGIDYISDVKRLSILFNNLMSNAIKYQDSKKDNKFLKVMVHQEPKKGDITLTFEDNGLGIDEAYIDKIFDMFYRASLESFGSGLGLYIVSQVIEKLKGGVEVSSELGQWTKFEFVLPNLAHLK